jgi:arsenate reductase-like glutaredoxin family protein
MKLIVKTISKKQEKAVKEFLDKNDVEFSVVNEDQVIYKTAPKKILSKKEKQVLDGLSQSVEFVKKYSKGKVKAKSINQLLNEL